MGERYSLKIPARINILGNPTDANEGDFYTISGAINIFAGAAVAKSKKLTFQIVKKNRPYKQAESSEISSFGELRFKGDDRFKIFKATLRHLLKFYPELRSKIEKKKVKISIWTDVPRQSGLGGSSLFVLLILNALREFYSLSKRELNDYVLAELTQRIEEIELGVTCGFADRYVPQLGGLAYIDYRGKLFHKKIFDEPFATYERLDRYAEHLSFIVVSSGIIRESGDIHSVMRTRYLEDYEKRRKNSKYSSPVLDKFELIAETAWKGKICLLQGDSRGFGVLMNENHRLINEIMLECGFSGGAGEVNNLLIDTALKNGAYGAKLAGAGGGGSVLILADNKSRDRVIRALQRKIDSIHLPDAKIYKVNIVSRGIRIRKLRR